MNKILLISTILVCFMAVFTFNSKSVFAQEEINPKWWDFQAIDTMKYSRDLSRQMLYSNDFDETIDLQVKQISKTGATHVAIATPYDEEFRPFLKRWVNSARKHNLKVWFRGNWSGWEGWFEYPTITREDHLSMTRNFILENKELFENGDIFTSCPECENGGPGDPRLNGQVNEHKKFLIDLYEISKQSFDEIGVEVESNYFSMNGDVARLIMDKETTKKLDGVVVIDHYVDTPEKLASDIQEIAEKSGGIIILGEVGVPIPDIHGNFTSEQQAAWMDEALYKLVELKQLKGMNYWVGYGGSTAIWTNNGIPKPSVEIISNYFNPNSVRILLENELGDMIKDAVIILPNGKYVSNKEGVAYVTPSLPKKYEIQILAPTYEKRTIQVNPMDSVIKVELSKDNETIIFKLRKMLLELRVRFANKLSNVLIS